MWVVVGLALQYAKRIDWRIWAAAAAVLALATYHLVGLYRAEEKGRQQATQKFERAIEKSEDLINAETNVALRRARDAVIGVCQRAPDPKACAEGL